MANHILRSRAISRRQLLARELWREPINVHLEVLVVRPWTDRAFDHLTNGVDRFAFPDADAEFMIVRAACIAMPRWKEGWPRVPWPRRPENHLGRELDESL